MRGMSTASCSWGSGGRDLAGVGIDDRGSLVLLRPGALPAEGGLFEAVNLTHR